MPDIDDVLADAQREIKAIGDNVKALKETTDKSLAEVRKIAEDAPKSVASSEQFKKDMEALTAGVLEKSDALTTKVKSITDGAIKAAADRMDELEKKLNRGKLGGNWSDGDVGTKAVKAFARDAKARRGELKADFDPDKVDFDEIKAYNGAFNVYLRKDDKGLQGAESKAMSVGSDPDGGYMVTPTIGQVITGVNFETSPMRQVADIQTISSDAIEYPRDDDQAAGGWVGEQEDRPETGTPKVGMQRIPVHELYANPKVTQKLLEDNAWDIETWLGNKIGDIFGRTEATAFVVGNGIKKPRGFTTYASGTYVAGGTGKIEQVAAGTGGQVGWDDLINVLTALKEFYLNGARWMMQRQSVGKVMLLKDGEGRYIWQQNQQAGKPSVLLGYEVSQAADMAPVGAAALPIAFGNFKMGYQIVDRVGISTLRDPFSAKPFVQFYTRKRVGGDVVNFEAIKLLQT
ncbi:phage major capsid protein, HK97 family [Bradyrhizobium brasilense]|uniref:Phage major capsid protein, HK97 family n=1 Tax=Bradyrhizobium brasilense TaxID=1419277 RepID=A0A1G6IK65_9BRAD|nr:phage major capsid protein [Bradyrhizobium brasilense]SDC06919.1 phage major capsid protein, HK97 family [Bradyrhizobium brasilense]